MDSQPDSLDIAKLKRFALGFDETDVSQALVSEAESQISSSHHVHPDAASRPIDVEERVSLHQSTSRAKTVESVVAVHVLPPTNHDVHKITERFLNSQEEPLSSVPESNIRKMSTGDSGTGDTQPISQSIYENIIARGKSFQPSQTSELDFSDAHNASQESFQIPVKEGESGHINLLADFESNKPVTAAQHYSSDDGVISSKDGQSSPSQFPSHNVFPESQRFLETPITVEKSREVSNMAATTPSLPRNPLAADLSSSGGILPLSQLFRATQTPVSPFATRLPSGPLSDRPSPDLPIQARPLSGYTSSPSRTPRANFTRTHTDPFSYVSMDESQKRRNQKREERRTRSAENIDSEQPIDRDFEEESSLVQRLNRRRDIDHETSLRLASVTHERSSSDSAVKPSTASTKLLSREISVEADETQEPSGPLNGENMSEVETDKEDVTTVPHSQNRQAPASSEEDKENHVEPYTDTAHATATAHDRLSQALDMHIDSTMTDTPPAEQHELTGGTYIRNSQQVINVRDSQPSPSQGAFKHKRTTSLLSQSESVHIRSSYDDSSPPTKRQRRQHITEREPPLSPSKQSGRQYAPPSVPVRSPTQSAQHKISSIDHRSSAQNGAEKPSSMPSLVANTPMNKAGYDTIPETSIPESSPHRNQAPLSALGPLNQLPTMQETEEDDDLPPQRHLRQRNSGSLPSKLSNAEKPKFLLGSSPDKGSIKTLSELSADMSPQSAHGDALHIDDFFNKEDDDFSRIFETRLRTPRKRLQTTKDYISPQFGSSPLKNVESAQTPDVEQSALPEPQLDDPESPSVTPMRAVARRQRGRPPRLGEDMYEMEGSPRARKPTTTPSVSGSFQHLPAEETASEPYPPQSHKSSTHNSQLSVEELAANQAQTKQTTQEGSVAPNSTNLAVTNSQAENLTSDIQSPEPEDPIIAPNQVLAFWNGRKRAYYPATFMHACQLQRCVVAFADSGPVDVALGSVKRLQLRVGDAIKIDFPKVPKVTHIIRGFSQKLKPDDLTQRNEYGYLPVTDIYGNSTVIVSAKQRKSIPSGGQLESEQTIEVPIYSIYLDMILWNQMKGRSFAISEKAEPAPPVFQTPSRGASTPISPASRLSRTHLTLRLGLFSGMVFAISLGDQDAHKTRIVKLISANGGQILQDGFEELFEYPSSPPAITQPEASSQTEVAEEEIDFRLASMYENTGFACLIADKHSRRAKYMQALALNVPCLSRRWVEDCVSQNRVLSWDHYLLPAGESSFLYGAIKSRALTPVAADKALFSQTFDGRAKLLDGQSVLLVLGRGKREERHKAYIFLMYALGAARIARVLDLKAAKVLLRKHAQKHGGQPRWDWLYVDDSEEAAAEALIGGDPYETSFGSKKRKRSALFMESDEATKASPRVMSNDLVCQSLILGKICK